MAACVTPFSVVTNGEEQRVACGNCYPCLMNRVSNWSFRLMQETRRAHSAHFVTLTYDNYHVPITEKGFLTLSKQEKRGKSVSDDLTDYFKRLRKANKHDMKIKYYACGEYGSKTMRPHYHIILFNSTIEAIVDSWRRNGKYIGDVHIGEVTEASVCYTLKYINKPKKIPLHKNDDRRREYAVMSKGIGSNYWDENRMFHMEHPESRCYVSLKGGYKIALPKYYRNMMDDRNKQLVADGLKNVFAQRVTDEFKGYTEKQVEELQKEKINYYFWKKSQEQKNRYL